MFDYVSECLQMGISTFNSLPCLPGFPDWKKDQYTFVEEDTRIKAIIGA